jgi:hypothetical protein
MITATEQHRLGNHVMLAFEQDGEDAYPGGRYVDAADWDSDPEAVVAEIAKYLAGRKPAPEPTPAVRLDPVSMTSAEVEVKLAELEEKRLADLEEVEEKLDVDAESVL